MEKTRQLWLLTALAVVAVFAGGYFVLVSPQTKKAGEVRTDVATTEATNATLQAQIAMLKQQAKQLPKEQARLAELSKKMPGNPALPSLIRTLSDTADAANLDMVALNPAKPVMAPTVPGAGAPTTAGATGTTVTSSVPVPGLAILPLEIRLKGHFAQIREFLASVEDLQRAFLVGGIDIKPTCRPADGDAAPDDCDPLLLDMKLDARVFMTVSPTQNTVRTPVAATTTEGK